MRLINSGLTFKNWLRSPVLLLVLLMLIMYLIFINYKTMSFMLVLRERLEMAKGDYRATEEMVTKEQISNFENSSQEAKDRYKKEFFNSLGEGEYVVFLHREKQLEPEEESRQMTILERYTQRLKLWWKNL